MSVRGGRRVVRSCRLMLALVFFVGANTDSFSVSLSLSPDGAVAFGQKGRWQEHRRAFLVQWWRGERCCSQRERWLASVYMVMHDMATLELLTGSGLDEVDRGHFVVGRSRWIEDASSVADGIFRRGLRRSSFPFLT